MSRPFEGTFRSLAKVEKHLDYLVTENGKLSVKNKRLLKENSDLWELIKVQSRYNSEEEKQAVEDILKKYESSSSS